MRKNYYLFLLLLSNISFAQETFVELIDGSSIHGKVKIESPILGDDYVMLNDSNVIKVDRIKAVQTKEGYFRWVQKGGLSQLRRFVERKDKGNVDLYYDWITGWSHDPFMQFSYSNYVACYFAKGSGPMLKINRGNLEKAFADYPPSLKPLKASKTLSFVIAGFLVSGVAIMATAFKGVDKDHPPATGRLIAGGIVANLAWIPGLMKMGKIDEAIRLYNQKP